MAMLVTTEHTAPRSSTHTSCASSDVAKRGTVISSESVGEHVWSRCGVGVRGHLAGTCCEAGRGWRWGGGGAEWADARGGSAKGCPSWGWGSPARRARGCVDSPRRTQ